MGFTDIDYNKRYTYADYLKWTMEEAVELIQGFVFRMAPAPSRLHQRISGDIYFAIRTYLSGKECQVYTAPFDVRLPRKAREMGDDEIITVVQPNICVICDKEKLDERGCIGAPDLIVEILSPDNTKKETCEKFDVYEESGVREYWMVYPSEKYIIIYTLSDSRKFVKEKTEPDPSKIHSVIFPNFELNLDELFAE
jgi:Uma2 family endonuclease